MTPRAAPKPKPTPLILTPKDEGCLLALARFRFLTAQEITHLLYSKGSLTYARARLSALAGNKDVTDEDLTNDYPLWRVSYPTGKRGNQERIWCLSATGARIVERLGHTLPFRLKRSKLTFSHSSLLHDLSRNRFVVALLTWAKKSKPNLSIESRLYEIAKQPPTVEIPVHRPVLKEGKPVKIPVMTKVRVIPDGEVLVTNTSTGQHLLILLEIDHNTLARERLQNHIAALLAYTKSPHFRAHYRNIPYRIVYATQGVTDAASKSRLAYLCKFTMQLLTERKREKESHNFLFTTINFAKLYEDANRLFGSEEPSWYLPGDVKGQSPIALFTDAKPQPQKE
jgi:hypothetical protein